MPDLRRRLWSRVPHSGRGEAARFALRVGPAGIYVANALLCREDGTEDLFVHTATDGAVGALTWVGSRGNLVALSQHTELSAALGSEIAAMPLGWRIAIADGPFLAALLASESRPPLVCREQVYYRADPSTVGRTAPECRLAEPADSDALCEAALALNESDLCIPRDRVHRGWLRRTVRRRVRDGRTYVVGPLGAPRCKLDVGSRGPAGIVLEGVFTDPAWRSRGLASTLVRSVIAALAHDGLPIVLHVAESNVAARAAYARAGMQPVDHVGILLRDR
ncbi:MAG: GNAT family N-acetyltransferase [Planctomycetota bacterium]